MAMIKCHCGKRVSSKLRYCPHCKHRVPFRFPLFRVLLLIGVAYFGWFGFVADRIKDVSLPSLPRPDQLTLDESWKLSNELKGQLAADGLNHNVIDSIHVSRLLPGTVTATITVKNLWHVVPYQIRFQRMLHTAVR